MKKVLLVLNLYKIILKIEKSENYTKASYAADETTIPVVFIYPVVKLVRTRIVSFNSIICQN